MLACQLPLDSQAAMASQSVRGGTDGAATAWPVAPRAVAATRVTAAVRILRPREPRTSL
ncbi:putative secreted protein [Streptomyces sp. SAI-195]|uniref:hypothetical protein n=1 Tax=Streptomyces sp. SAI-195 TaxID=3377734 RepID=UPI003C7B9CE5